MIVPDDCLLFSTSMFLGSGYSTQPFHLPHFRHPLKYWQLQIKLSF
nr:MAG TPA: hypothetical protein [Caudoviricetes sp.]DAP67787.1 MAG TPA: hypothetical protein [Caudoviricetes sp.]